MIQCKHLDYDLGKYGPDIELKNVPGYPEVRYWFRGPRWTDNGPGQATNTAKVQFCQKRGRIPGIFQCYFPEEMSCYESERANEAIAKEQG